MNSGKGPVMMSMTDQGKASTSELKIIHSVPKRSTSKPDKVDAFRGQSIM